MRLQLSAPAAAPVGVARAFEFRGAALALQSFTGREIVISGPSETGKTIGCLNLADTLAWKYPGIQGVFVRKIRADMHATVLAIWKKEFVDHSGGDIKAFGGEDAEYYEYSNGSRIWVGGIDRPGRVLSGGFDFAYINQVEELDVGEFETLLTRTTGRAGTLQPGMLFGDCNPSLPTHWILLRARAGTLTFLESFHRDNPTLFDREGNILPRGTQVLGTLSSLTGSRRSRLYEGLWTQPEGVVYPEFSEDNIVDTEPDSDVPIELAVDDGYIDPRAILFVQRTGTQILVFDEIYHSRHLEEECVGEVVTKCGERYGWLDEEKTVPKKLPEIAVGSHEAKTLQVKFRKANIPYRFKLHEVVDGISVVRSLIRDGKGVRILLVHRRCENLIREITSGYQYPPGSARSNSEKPMDGNDHTCDALRYWAWVRART